MAAVKIADILKPENWAEYGRNRTTELSALWQAGIVTPVAGITLPKGGGTINMPHFNDLTGESQVLSDTVPLVPKGITTGKQVAVVIGRGDAWSVNDLAGVFAGADPAKAIMDMLAGYWARQSQRELISVLTGVFGAASMAGLVKDISALATPALNSPSANNFIDAVQLLGDAKDQLTAIAMHSMTEAFLAKQDLIVYEKPAEGTMRVPYYMGKRVIVDDGLPVASGVYTTYLFGPGAIGYDEAPLGNGEMETDRDILIADTYFTMRKHFILHPVGTKWVGTAAGAFPSRNEMAAANAWERVYDFKRIPIVAFKHKLLSA